MAELKIYTPEGFKALQEELDYLVTNTVGSCCNREGYDIIRRNSLAVELFEICNISVSVCE